MSAEGLSIKLDHKALEDALASQLLNSSLGESIEKAFAEITKSNLRGERSLIYMAVKDEMTKIIRQVVSEQYAERIKALVSEKMTDDLLAEVWSQGFERTLGKFV